MYSIFNEIEASLGAPLRPDHDECGICQDQLTDDKATLTCTECCQSFCRDCLQTWFLQPRQARCPIRCVLTLRKGINQSCLTETERRIYNSQIGEQQDLEENDENWYGDEYGDEYESGYDNEEEAEEEVIGDVPEEISTRRSPFPNRVDMNSSMSPSRSAIFSPPAPSSPTPTQPPSEKCTLQIAQLPRSFPLEDTAEYGRQIFECYQGAQGYYRPSTQEMINSYNMLMSYPVIPARSQDMDRIGTQATDTAQTADTALNHSGVPRGPPPIPMNIGLYWLEPHRSTIQDYLRSYTQTDREICWAIFRPGGPFDKVDGLQQRILDEMFKQEQAKCYPPSEQTVQFVQSRCHRRPITDEEMNEYMDALYAHSMSFTCEEYHWYRIFRMQTYLSQIQRYRRQGMADRSLWLPR